MLLLVEDEQVGDEKEGKWDERVVVEEGPQEGKAAHPKEEGDKEYRKLKSSFCPNFSKIDPTRVNSRALKLTQPGGK